MEFIIKRANAQREPVAYIDQDGDLVVKIGKDGLGKKANAFGQYGEVYTDLTFSPESAFSEADIIFKGDTVTIQF